jgi:hypothetical protein
MTSIEQPVSTSNTLTDYWLAVDFEPSFVGLNIGLKKF